MILSDPSATKPFDDQVQDLSALRILAHMELGNELPSESGARIPLNGNMKRAFSIDITCDVGIQPFLLIVRTGRIFTAHAHTLDRGCDTNE